MMYIESKKSAVFVLVICTYKQSQNELQQPDLPGRLWNQQHIYSFATPPCVVISNDIFQWLIYKYYLQLSVVTQHFHFLEIPKTDVWCLLQRIDLWLYEWQSTPQSTRTGTVYRNTDNITVCLLKNGYRFLHLLPKIIVNLLWLTCEHVSKLIPHNKPFSMSSYLKWHL